MFMDQRRVGGECGFSVDDGRQRVEVEFNQFGGVLGRVAGG